MVVPFLFKTDYNQGLDQFCTEQVEVNKIFRQTGFLNIFLNRIVFIV